MALEKPGRAQVLLFVVAVVVLIVAVALLMNTPSLHFHTRAR